MTKGAKYLMKQVQIELAMGQIRAIQNSNIPSDEQYIRIQRVTDDLGKSMDPVEQQQQVVNKSKTSKSMKRGCTRTTE